MAGRDSAFGTPGRAGRGHDSTGDSLAGTRDAVGPHPNLQNPDSIQPGPAQPVMTPNPDRAGGEGHNS